MAQFPWLSPSHCRFPLVSPLCPLLLTWHPPAVTGIVHLPLRLLVNWPRFAPPFTHPTHPLQIPRTPTAPRLTMTTSGIFRLLLSGTLPFQHRWTQLLKQQTSFTVYHLPTEENKLPFSVSVCSKQTEVCRFRFLYIYIYIYRKQYCFAHWEGGWDAS